MDERDMGEQGKDIVERGEHRNVKCYLWKFWNGYFMFSYVYVYIQMSQNSRILNSERGREGPSGARNKVALSEEDINTLILFNT
jgi:hypothetical protein